MNGRSPPRQQVSTLNLPAPYVERLLELQIYYVDVLVRMTEAELRQKTDGRCAHVIIQSLAVRGLTMKDHTLRVSIKDAKSITLPIIKTTKLGKAMRALMHEAGIDLAKPLTRKDHAALALTIDKSLTALQKTRTSERPKTKTKVVP